ncbi:cation:proton antiporter [bacterium]|nr:cation:proton antiporter [bacterium]
MDDIIFQLSIVIIVTTILSIILELSKQPILIAFIFSGLIVGPHGLGLVNNTAFFQAIGQIGIILLLYLIGLELKTKIFSGTFGKGTLITFLASAVIFVCGLGIGFITQIGLTESLYLGMVLIFSSTVVVMKLLNDQKDANPYVRQYCIAALITQDILAIMILLFISSTRQVGYFGFFEGIKFFIEGIFVFLLAFVLQKFVLKGIARKIFHKPDIMFLLGLAWCFLFAEVAEFFNFSREIGAFIAGISLTFLPSYKLRVIVKKSETIRDFFMILFFFVLGANIEFTHLEQFGPLIAVSILFVVIVKPIIFKLFFNWFKVVPNENLEISVRLGQLSEFSVIVILLGASTGHISMNFAMAIQIVMFLSIIISTYLVQYIPFYKFNKTSKNS